MADDATQFDTLMVQAARLKCVGATWEAIAAAVGRSVDTVRHWPLTRPNDWYPALQAAVAEVMPEVEREAVHLLRKGMQVKDKSGNWIYTEEGRKAAIALLRHLRECRAKSIEIGGLGGGIQIIITPAKEPEEETDV